MITLKSLDRLKAQLQTTNLQQKNFPLYQVISQLIDQLRQSIDSTNTAITGLGAAITAVSTTISSNAILNKFIPLDGEDGADGLPGIQGKDGIPGRDGLQGIPGLDGEDGIDGLPGMDGRIGIDGARGLDGHTFVPIDGEDGIDGLPGIPGPQGLVGGNSGVKFWFNITDASDIAGYYKAQGHPSHNAEATNVQVCAGTGNNLLYKFVTEPGQPGVYWIQDGAAFRHIHCAVTTAAGFARYLVETYYCNADGTGETLVGSSYSDSTTDTSIDEVNWDLYKLNAVPITPTQRLVWKLYVARVSGPANVSVTTYFEGSVHPSYVESTVMGTQIGPPGPMGSVGPSMMLGIDGLDGEEGIQGLPGIQGTPGVIGVNGSNGRDGFLAMDGEDGAEGPIGVGIPGRAVQIYEQVSAPTYALPGDFWIVP